MQVLSDKCWTEQHSIYQLIYQPEQHYPCGSPTELNDEGPSSRTVIFTLNGQAVSILLPWHSSDDTFRRIATALSCQVEEIALFHFASRPQDVIQLDFQCMLLQRQDERRPAHIMKLILLDIEVYESQEIQPSAFRRKAHRLPATMMWISVFRPLGLEQPCSTQTAHCHLWRNADPIDSNQAHRST